MQDITTCLVFEGSAVFAWKCLASFMPEPVDSAKPRWNDHTSQTSKGVVGWPLATLYTVIPCSRL